MATEKSTIVHFTETLGRLMDERSINNASLAAAVGVTPTAIGNYRNGRIPKAEELLRIAEFFDVEIKSLLQTDTKQKAGAHAVARADAQSLVGPAAAKVLVKIVAQLMNEARRLDPNVEFPKTAAERVFRYGTATKKPGQSQGQRQS